MKAAPVRLRIRRTSGWQEYNVIVPADAHVLDALEAAGTQDQSLLFRHACHHSSCGSCGVRINGREQLPCITPLGQLGRAGQALRVEPLRNFPIIGDLLVDFGDFLRRLDSVGLPLQREAEPLAEQGVATRGVQRIRNPEAGDGAAIPSSFFNRLESCIECGLCVSACPVAGLDPQYAGPAVLAATGRLVAEPRGRDAEAALRAADDEHGLWRCHATFECSEVCPAHVEPAREIMSLRGKLLRSRTRQQKDDNP